MKEEKQDKPKAPRGPQPTVEEREIRAVLVAVIRDSQNPATAMEYLDELEFLAETADIKTVKRFTQRLPQPMSKIYVGPGKLMAVGTSLPELATCVVAAMKGKNQLALGNVIGSNIFNITLIIGTSAAISPFEIQGARHGPRSGALRSRHGTCRLRLRR